jgi:hypothetical protein
MQINATVSQITMEIIVNSQVVLERIQHHQLFALLVVLVNYLIIALAIKDTLVTSANTLFVMEETVQIQMYVLDMEIVHFLTFVTAHKDMSEMIVN